MKQTNSTELSGYSFNNITQECQKMHCASYLFSYVVGAAKTVNANVNVKVNVRTAHRFGLCVDIKTAESAGCLNGHVYVYRASRSFSTGLCRTCS